MRPIDLSLYLVLQPDACRDSDPIEVALSAVSGGVSIIQLRDKELEDRPYFELAKALYSKLKPRGIPFLLNDRVDIAKLLDVDGVHLGQRDLDFRLARRLLGPSKLIGLSLEPSSSLDFDQDHFSDLPDYLGVSPIFETPTKPELKEAWGIQGLEKLRSETQLPLVAIGGMNRNNVAEVAKAGAEGVAVVSAICGAPNPESAARELRALVPPMKNRNLGGNPDRRYRRVLSIAGSDSGGGAGIQADLKTFSALGCYGMTAITAVTAQNTKSVLSVQILDEKMITQQIQAVFADLGVDAIKIGMLGNELMTQLVARELKKQPQVPVVLDPVMVAKSGDVLLEEAAIHALIDDLFPLTEVLTPNIPEAEKILSREISDPMAMEIAAKDLAQMGPKNVLLKGGHAKSVGRDCFYSRESNQIDWLIGKEVETKNTHGTGCTLSSAIASFRARGYSPLRSAHSAKEYLQGALEVGGEFSLGEGNGPVHHFWNQWS